MKVDKRIREMPWPKPWHGGNERVNFRVTVAESVVNGRRHLVVTFLRNRNHKDSSWSRKVIGEDFRLVCCKKKGMEDAVVITEKGKGAARKALNDCLRQWNTGTAYCYPEISERDEKALCRWLGVREKTKKSFSYNHAMPQLGQWADEAMEAALKRERAGRGELTDEDVELCPKEIPEGLIDYIHRVVLPEDNVLLYKKGNVRGTCFVCGQKVKMPQGYKFYQGNRTSCPNCGRIVWCYLEDSDRFSVDNVEPVATIQLGTDGETLFIRQWRLLRPSEPEELWEHTGKYLKEVARYAVRGRRAAKWQIEGKEAWGMRAYRYDMKEWVRMKNVAEVYDGSYYFFLPPNWEEILSTTSLKYMDMEEYDRIDPEDRKNRNMIRFCMDWARYPGIELLWKAGYKGLVNERVNGKATAKTRNAVRWSGKSIPEIFPFPTRLLRGLEPGEWELRKVIELTELWNMVEAGDIKEQEIVEIGGCRATLEEIKEALPYATVHKVVKYVNKQYSLEEERRTAEGREAGGHEEIYRDPTQIGSTYRDYIKDCKELRLNLRDKQILFPPDLEAAHQRTIVAIKYETNKEKEKAYQAAVKWLERLAWEKDGLVIRPAATVRELIEEGETLHHCVGGYADRVARKETAIFLIRRKEEPDKPYYTLELREQKIVQCRTDHNRSYEIDETVRTFVREWMETAVLKKTARKVKNKEVNVA